MKDKLYKSIEFIGNDKIRPFETTLLKIIITFAFVFVIARDMGRVKIYKVWAVWLLLAGFTLPFAVKAIHTYHIAEHSEHGCPDKSRTHHNCNDCPVCRFVLSSFTEAVIVNYDFKVILPGFKPVIPFQNNLYRQVPVPYGLRAPPVI